ncbi:MAG: hypothetical protein K6T63_05560 [Alicyclobacillus herbarius]|uniref:P-loop ATPase, Sll1717 family n=1 Tax=Alicyclobacillus herbarius TaxID=122960 RepID=UPI002355DDE5|nr:hypothetical protein [Alicyclobacillus herbarius]MCL6632084.1 hypothetical protein [Alicyclobacillus herbarius]
MNEWDKRTLLEHVQSIAPRGAAAENESDDDLLKNFLPIPDHRRMLEPDILLILGGRGVGKTEMFRVLARPTGREALFRHIGSRAVSVWEKTSWIPGFGDRKQQKNYPSQEAIEDLLTRADGLDWRAFWIGLLLGVLLRDAAPAIQAILAASLPAEVHGFLKNEPSRLSKWFPVVRSDLESINDALDKVDNLLIESDCWLFITYDELDRIVRTHAGLADPIRELLAFWLDRWRRWERLRPKIFLRNDLFNEDYLSFPDASKFSGHRIRLEWTSHWLYQLLAKRLANSGELMKAYLDTIPGLITEHDEYLGWLTSTDEELYHQLMEMMIGKFMGANPRKGLTYRWIPNHLQDAEGRIAPRSFLKIFSLAAERELGEFRSLPDSALLRPMDLQGALMDTSKDRIAELKEEYPWIEALTSSIEGIEVPAPRSIFLQAIEKTQWEPEGPPKSTAEQILRYLEELGIIEIRSDGRINAPEIYLYGFKLKRRGGIKRPR